MGPSLARDLEKAAAPPLPLEVSAPLPLGIVVTRGRRVRLVFEEAEGLPALPEDRREGPAAERSARVEDGDRETLPLACSLAFVVATPRFWLATKACPDRLWRFPAANSRGSPVFRLSTNLGSMLLTLARSAREAPKSPSGTTVSPEPGS